MLENITPAPPDPILGLTAAFNKDPNPNKINLGVGVYKDEAGNTPVFSTVKKAERMLLEKENSKDYLAIEGSPQYAATVQEMLFGKDHEIIKSKRAVTAQTPGGTGALRVAGDLLKKFLPSAPIWLSAPTWANHNNIFKAAGLEIAEYPYYNAEAKNLDFEKMIKQLEAIPEGHIVLLHGCCHNPTGIDPTPDQWKQVAAVIGRRGLLPVVDLAYQGLAHGIAEDAAGMRALCGAGRTVLVSSSFSKNFGLYNERVGALTVVAPTAEAAQTIFTNVQAAIRANYSNPPSHGGAIVATILGDPALRAEWETEVAEIRNRIRRMRVLFVETLKAKGVKRDFSFVAGQNGMFSLSGLTKDQVELLRSRYAIYIVGSGRINVAGMTTKNMDPLCQAIAEVL